MTHLKILVIALLLVSLDLFAEEKSDTAKKPSQKIGTVADGKNAAAVLEDIFRAYGSGDVNFIRERIDPQMIGFQKLLDEIALEANQCKQLKIHLLDTQIKAGPDLVVIQTGWEKRCLELPNFTPRLFAGKSTFLMQSSGSGWVVNGISGTNPLSASLPISR